MHVLWNLGLRPFPERSIRADYPDKEPPPIPKLHQLYKPSINIQWEGREQKIMKSEQCFTGVIVTK